MRPLSFSLLFLLALLPGVARAGGPYLPPAAGAAISGYESPDTVAARIASSGPHRIEGVWRFPGSGASIAVERCDRPGADGRLATGVSYRMVVLRSDNRAIRPGTVMGVLEPSASATDYDACIYTGCRGDTVPDSPKHFTVTLTDSGSRMEFKRVKSRYTINLWRMLPYMFRYAVGRRNNTGEAPQGCVKVFPVPAVPDQPRYL